MRSIQEYTSAAHCRTRSAVTQETLDSSILHTKQNAKQPVYFFFFFLSLHLLYPFTRNRLLWKLFAAGRFKLIWRYYFSLHRGIAADCAGLLNFFSGRLDAYVFNYLRRIEHMCRLKRSANKVPICDGRLNINELFFWTPFRAGGFATAVYSYPVFLHSAQRNPLLLQFPFHYIG